MQMQAMNASAMVRRMITDVFSLAFFLLFLWGEPSGVQHR